MSTTIDTVKEIWQTELKLDTVGDNEDFFDIGGHSLTMASIQTTLAARFGVEVPMDVLFERSTVTDIGGYLDEIRAGAH